MALLKNPQLLVPMAPKKTCSNVPPENIFKITTIFGPKKLLQNSILLALLALWKMSLHISNYCLDGPQENISKISTFLAI